MQNINNLDLWKKLEHLLEVSYYQGLEAFKGPLLSKGDIVILSAILAEQKIGNGNIWDTLQNDVVRRLEMERTSAQSDPEMVFSGDFSSYSLLLDCIYKSTNQVSEDMLNKIAFNCIN